VPTGKTPGLQEVAGNGVMRDWFVGILWAIGVFLVLYRGYGRRENTALNIAGMLLIMVAMVPMDWTCGTACPKISTRRQLAAEKPRDQKYQVGSCGDQG
jgi:hypothetical protein